MRIDDCYERLRIAIVVQAYNDLVLLYRSGCESLLTRTDTPICVTTIEKWFRSQAFEALSDVDGTYLIESAKKKRLKPNA